MFTGIVDDVGTLESVRTTDAGVELRVRSRYADLAAGESVALNGVCLTVREPASGTFEVAAVQTTVGRTTLGSWKAGRRVNLERALKLGDRLGGHLVQGHVDCVGRVEATRNEGDALLIDVSVPAEFEPLIVLHGSITVDGVSLTVNALIPGGLQLSIVEYSLRHTTLGELKPGDIVNVETDLIGKHIQRLVASHMGAGLTPEPFDFSLHN
jgi:riboflavin synthase